MSKKCARCVSTCSSRTGHSLGYVVRQVSSCLVLQFHIVLILIVRKSVTWTYNKLIDSPIPRSRHLVLFAVLVTQIWVSYVMECHSSCARIWIISGLNTVRVNESSRMRESLLARRDETLSPLVSTHSKMRRSRAQRNMSSKFHNVFLSAIANPCHCEEYREEFQGHTDDIAKHSYSTIHNGGEYKYVFCWNLNFLSFI